MKKIAVIFFVAFVVTIRCANAGDALHYEPTIVTLDGVVILEDHYGPPNYGETPDKDKKFIVPVLKLEAPINVSADRNDDLNADSFNNARSLQLIGLSAAKYTELANQHIRIEGSLVEKQNANHFTDVLVNVKSIKQVR